MFQVRGLDPHLFEDLFALSDDALAAKGARRVMADRADAYPCRVSLSRAPAGQELLLVHYAHQTAASSPYRAAGPIFVSRLAQQSFRDEVPPMLEGSLVSLKAYDGAAFIVDAEVVDGGGVRDLLAAYFGRSDIHHVDAHFARRGCFAARFERA